MVSFQSAPTKLQEEAEQLRKVEIQEVISGINSKISLYGIKQNELKFLDSLKPEMKADSKPPKNKLPPKYRNKETGQEWSGRGHEPKWLTTEINQGYARDDFEIKDLKSTE